MTHASQAEDEAPGGAAVYSAKEPWYFEGCRRDYVLAFPVDPSAAILELGCATGTTGRLALALGRCGTYCGVELVPDIAEVARRRLTEVVVGDIEEIDLPWRPGTFSGLILGEVLEHLRDPWLVLRRLRPLLRPGALVFASTPNVAHREVIAMLARGRWNLADSGTMDRTHLRWFTPSTFADAFVDAGYVVDTVGPLGALGPGSKVVDFLLRGRCRYLWHRQIDLHAHVADDFQPEA